MSRVLGIDYGERRVGLAISDPLRVLATPLETIEVQSDKQTLRAIEAVCQRAEITELVLGFPINMDGTHGLMAEKVKTFADQLDARLRLPVHLQDERMSSAEAQRVLLAADVSRQGRKKVVDKLAAQLILQSWLDRAANAESDMERE